ncbi:MAG: polyprenyl synthetase family protein [Actinomycetota bacterium]
MNAKKSDPRAKSLLDSAKSKIDDCLEGWLRSTQEDFATNNGEQIVAEVGRSAIGRGGRIRPLLCCCGYAIAGGEGGLTDKRIIRAAASIELLHTFAILHDDVMDGSELRRGEPSLFRRIADEREDLGDEEAVHYGVSVAILAGDLALVLSDQLFSRSGFDADRLLRAYGPLSRMRLDAVAGQYLDLTHSGRPAGAQDPDLAVRISRLKTGSYSVEGPLLIGATLGGATEAAARALREFARPLGEAFQLTDDLMGLFGDPASTGKDAENDIRKGKPTPLISSSLAMATGGRRSDILAIWGNPRASAADLARLRAAVRDSGALGVMSARIRALVAASCGALNDPERNDLDEQTAALLQHLAQGILARAGETVEGGI